ncbi:hypothetical protein BpHYR1_045308 [Brachionus plicatilis]|uniref:Uncharacterized protein n=1 Tax=Brachionus plicatilis TaxID=10195 RepID=A0A3M7SSM3_BRAPC|nr:hypothetical protein BpHYR1_045308 [Brachionus plicatilis]
MNYLESLAVRFRNNSEYVRKTLPLSEWPWDTAHSPMFAVNPDAFVMKNFWSRIVCSRKRVPIKNTIDTLNKSLKHKALTKKSRITLVLDYTVMDTTNDNDYFELEPFEQYKPHEPFKLNSPSLKKISIRSQDAFANTQILKPNPVVRYRNLSPPTIYQIFWQILPNVSIH